MSVVLWKVVTAIVLCSAAGALLREATIIFVHGAPGSSSGLTLAVSGIGGAVVGISMGWVATATTTEAAWQMLNTAALNIGTAILMAAIGLGIVRSLRSR